MPLDFQGSGSGDKVTLETMDVASGLSTMSITAWFNVTSFTSPGREDGRIISKASSSSTADHIWMMSTAQLGTGEYVLRVRLKTSTTESLKGTASSALSVDTWYFGAFTYDGTNLLLYLDASEIQNLAKTGTIAVDNTVEAMIGDGPVNPREFYGKIEDVRIYEKALSVAELETIYATRGNDGIVHKLLSRWLLNEK